MLYKVKAKNKRGYMQESESTTEYSRAFTYAIECKNSGEYSTIIIVSADENEVNKNTFFLCRIIL